MGIKQISIRKWIDFLQAQGLSLKNNSNGHDKWDNLESPLFRPVVFPNHHNFIATHIIGTCLKTMGITNSEFEEILQMRAMVHVSEIREKVIPVPNWIIVYKDSRSNEENVVRVEAFNKQLARNSFHDTHGYHCIIKDIIIPCNNDEAS